MLILSNILIILLILEGYNPNIPMKEKKDQEPVFRFMAIFNRWGMACASNLPGAIHHLYENPAVALIYDPSSQLNWERIIKDFKGAIFSSPLTSVKEVVSRFNDFLNSDYGKTQFGKEKKYEIIFIGFDNDEFYPYKIRCEISIDANGKIDFIQKSEKRINGDTKAFISTLGHFNYVIPVIDGVSPDFETTLMKHIQSSVDKFQHKLIQKSRELGSERQSVEIPETFLKEEILGFIKNSQAICHSEAIIGIDTFSVEELGDSVVNLINSEVHFSYLKNKKKGPQNVVCERAVMTIPEGFTWLQHKKTN